MAFISKNEDFICENCGEFNPKDEKGGIRNHCKKCLYSKHLDQFFPGDRKSKCGGKMIPLDIEFKASKGYMIKHKCEICGYIGINKILDDDDFLSFIEKRNIDLRF